MHVIIVIVFWSDEYRFVQEVGQTRPHQLTSLPGKEALTRVGIPTYFQNRRVRAVLVQEVFGLRLRKNDKWALRNHCAIIAQLSHCTKRCV